MLATNQKSYENVLSLKNVKDDDGVIQWEKFFNDGSVY
jgi:hypothetical protein